MRKSAGILLYKMESGARLYFLVHPGGPFWKGKEAGAWSIPKGEFGEDEDPLAAACREFEEETGTKVMPPFHPLPAVKQKSGKLVLSWLCAGDADAEHIQSNTFQLEYPYKSGKWITVPEVDKAGWFPLEEARRLINPGQSPLLDAAEKIPEGGHA